MMKNENQYTPVRFSHLTGYAGVGSIVRDNNDFLMVVTDIRYWIDIYGNDITTPILNIERVKKHLKITKSLHMPPTAQVKKDHVVGNPLPAIIFPSYVICKSCNRIHHKPWNIEGKEISKDLLCENCKKANLEQVTWCAVSSFGDLRDVPWHYICHLPPPPPQTQTQKQTNCKADYSKAYLEIIPGQKGRKSVRCTLCDSTHDFEQSDTKFKGSEHPFQPWSKDSKDKNILKNSTEKNAPVLHTIMEVNDPRAYSANKKRAIVIPPESNVNKNSIIYKLSCNSGFLKKIQDESRHLKRKKMLISAANDLRCSVGDIKKSLIEIECAESELNNITPGEMYSDEFKALMKEEDFNDGVDFITKHRTKEWLSYLEDISVKGNLKRIADFIENIVAVERLRVIEVFNGFTRRASDSDEQEDIIIPPDITGELDWLPAIELFGEGIFFTLNQKLLNEWESIHNIRLRADEISNRYENSTERTFENLEVVSPRFILLHTLSHLIIRELEISSGYPAASLKERIYSSQSENMAGILIYTAVPDTAGSLGGIVESAEPKNFLKLLDGVFKHAQWCSLDPVCTEHDGQGPSWLNRAACHACALIPETSCEYSNAFLDRVFIKGNEHLNIPSLLNA